MLSVRDVRVHHFAEQNDICQFIRIRILFCKFVGTNKEFHNLINHNQGTVTKLKLQHKQKALSKKESTLIFTTV